MPTTNTNKKSLLLQIAASSHSLEIITAAEQLARECASRYQVYLGNGPLGVRLCTPDIYTSTAVLEWECTRFKELWEEHFPVPKGMNAYYAVERRHERGYTTFEVVLSVLETDEAAVEWARSIEAHPLSQTWDEWGTV